MNDKARRPKTRLTLERETELADLADGVVEAHCLAKIEPEKIIAAKEIALIYDHYEDAFDGMLECDGGQFFIHCNLDRDNNPGTPRARFTLAHELGHYFIDEHRNNLLFGAKPHPSFSDREGANLMIEREADFFASRLLLPEGRFRPAAKNAPAGLSAVITLAQQFDVSATCAAIRVVTAETFPAVIIKWSDSGLSWKWSSRSFWDYGFRRMVAASSSLPRDSATAKALAASKSNGQPFENATTAAHWFPVGQKDLRNIILREEALVLGRFGVLTMLTLHGGNFPPEIIALRNQELGFDEE